MDASKSGLILADGIFEKDQKEFKPDFAYAEDIYIGDPQSPMKRSARPPADRKSDAFILTKLQKAGEAKGKELMDQFNKVSHSCIDKVDTDLTAPYETATTFANKQYQDNAIRLFTEDLTRIRNHVHAAQVEWSRACGKSKSKNSSKKQKGSGSSNTVDVSVNAARMFAEPVKGLIVTTPSSEAEIKASYAYTQWPHSPFAFQVAFRQLCDIKARSTKGGIAPCIREIDEMKTISGSYIRAVEKSYND